MTDIILYEAEKHGLLTSPPPTQRGVTFSEMRRAGQMFGGWFLKEHLWGFFHGSFSRDNGSVERHLKKLVDRGEWISHPFEKKLAYSVKRVNRKRSHTYPSTMYHELNVSGALVRFWHGDDKPKEYIPTTYFFETAKRRPEWALKLDSGTTIIFEFCTEDNFKKALKKKLEQYLLTLLCVAKPLVVFVCDVDMKLIQGFVERNRTLLTVNVRYQSTSPYFFADARVFRAQPLGTALTAPIYLWQDGQLGPLR
jgi:hypothetical protein